MTKKEIIEELTNKGVEFDKSSTKAKLEGILNSLQSIQEEKEIKIVNNSKDKKDYTNIYNRNGSWVLEDGSRYNCAGVAAIMNHKLRNERG